MRYLITLLIPLLLLMGCEKYELDRRMEALCKKDGGVKVFETVVLPASEYDNLEKHHWMLNSPESRDLENSLGPEYKYTDSSEIIKEGDPLKGEGRLDKYVVKIYRKSDRKLLGSFTQYGRAGGDLIVLGHWSMASCPVGAPSLLETIFIKGK